MHGCQVFCNPVFELTIILNSPAYVQAIRTLDGAEWQGRRLGVERARNVK